jgi:hypothetical protein
MAALTCVADIAVVGIGVPLNKTSVPGPKFVPVTVMVCPAVTLAGVTPAIVGNTAEIWIVTALDDPPPGAGFVTVTAGLPNGNGGASGAVSCVLETNVVGRFAPPTAMTAFGAKLLPVTVSTAFVWVAVSDDGLTLVTIGIGFPTAKLSA